MENPVKVVVDNTKEFQEATELLASLRVMVGIPQDKGARKESAPITNAALLYIHDNGAPEAGIPARPVMQPGIKARQDQINKGFEAAGRAAFQGKTNLMLQRLNAVGIIAVSGIKTAINSNTPPPLAESTLAARRRLGVTRTNTLVFSGQMRNAVTWVIRKVKRGA